MGKSFLGEFGYTIFGAAIIGGFIVLALIITPIALIGIPAYIAFRLWRDSPARAERLAHVETMTLYNHAVAGQITLSDEEIDAALAQHWPQDTPEALALQLRNIGRRIYEAEGLNPEVPPPPALCNTVEGGRYRDQLARIGQARRDRVMLLSALDAISLSLAPIAHAAPAIKADVLVDIKQFLHPLGNVVQQVIAPYFEDSEYNHFKALRARLDQNLQRTHRTQPIFPAEYKGDDVVDMYLAGTQLRDLFSLKTPFEIPEERRFEHMHIVAGSG